MNSQPKLKPVSVFSYPVSSGRRAQAIESMHSLVELLKSDYGIYVPVPVIDGHREYRQFSIVLENFLHACRKKNGWVDMHEDIQSIQKCDREVSGVPIKGCRHYEKKTFDGAAGIS